MDNGHESLDGTGWNPPPGVKRLLALAGIIGPVVGFGLSLAAQFVHPFGDPIYTTLSTMAIGQWGWLQTAAFLTFAVLMAAFDVALFLGTQGVENSVPALVFLLLTSAGIFLLGLYMVDIPGFPTPSGYIHGIATHFVALVFPIGTLLLTLGMWRDARWKSYANYTFATSLLAFILEFAPFVLPLPGRLFVGLMERVAVANGVIWTEVMAIRLFVMFSREGKAEATPARDENVAQ